MRRFASEILPARGINLSFKGPEDDRDLRLGADLRREVYLIFKKIVNNAARHSGCGQVEVDLGREGSWIQLKVADDGKGFDPTEAPEGNGLVSMRRRAAALGGEIVMTSGQGVGASVTLRVPFSPPNRFRAWNKNAKP
jgi:signal transduction histidine kinase